MTSQAQNACILLAAGRSERMGRDKLALPFRGKTILDASLEAVRGAAFTHRIFVGQRALVPGFTTVFIPSYQPMHSSIRAGLEHLPPHCEFFCVALADQPLLTPRHYELLLAEWEKAVATGKDLLHPQSEKGRPGNPAIVHRRYLPEILAHADDDRGCHYLFRAHPERVHAYRTEDPAFYTDIDTAEDYACAIANC